MSFSLFANAFAVLRADPTMSMEALADLAASEGTPEAAAALHTLSAPRTRLAAEVAFLPGLAKSSQGVLDYLRRGERPAGVALQGQALANVLAHLCDAGQADDGATCQLVGAQVEPGAPALLAAIAQDRVQAGQPTPQQAMLQTAQDEVAEAHAGVLVRLCAREPAGPERLARLIREAHGAAAVTFLRRCATAWSRETAGRITKAEQAVAEAEAAVLRAPGDTTVDAFVRTMTEWAELTAPERLIDAASGLDHEPSAAKARRWRGVAQRLAEGGAEPLAFTVAQALVAAMGDLPGFATLLRRDRDALASAEGDRALNARFAPLLALVHRLGSEPGPLGVALHAHGFGAHATGLAAEVWAAFCGVREAAPKSERPFAALDELACKLDAAGATAAALVLLEALAQSAEQAELAQPAARLRAHARALRRREGLARLQGLTSPWLKARQAVSTIDGLLPLADDPALHAQLSATRGRMQRRVATMGSGLAVGCAMLALVVIGVARQASSGSGATAMPQTVGATNTTATTSAVFRPVFVPPVGGASAAPVVQAGTPLPPAEPQAGLAPAAAPSAPAIGEPPMSSVPLAVHFDPITPSESEPDGRSGVYSLLEVRWCLFNEVRLDIVRDALAGQDEARKEVFNGVAAPWNALCSRYPANRFVTARVERETRENRGALVLQAQQIEHQIEGAAS